MTEKAYYLIEGSEMIVRRADQAFIPQDEDNVDYQEYLRWVAAGNEADLQAEPDPPAPEAEHHD